jgi:hypothetical protein
MDLSGLLAGSMTDPPALAFASNIARSPAFADVAGTKEPGWPLSHLRRQRKAFQSEYFPTIERFAGQKKATQSEPHEGRAAQRYLIRRIRLTVRGNGFGMTFVC